MFKQEANGGWYFDKEDGTGRVVSDWVKDADKWYYMNSNALMATGWLKLGDGDNEKWYYLNPLDYNAATGLSKGQMLTGWLNDNGKWYYLNTDEYTPATGKGQGEMLTGWLKWNNDWYYLNPSPYDGSTGLNKGQMLANTTAVINARSYSFDANGVMKNTTTTVSADSYISADCLDVIKGWEGFTDDGKKYYDCCGVLTQGYGMTGDEIAGLPDQISEETASSMLESLVNRKYAAAVKYNLDSKGVSLSQNQFDALVIFAYNCGTGALFGSTLYKNVCAGVSDADTIQSNFLAWDKGTINGVMTEISGLKKRRIAEANIYLNADYSGRP